MTYELLQAGDSKAATALHNRLQTSRNGQRNIPARAFFTELSSHGRSRVQYRVGRGESWRINA